MRDHSCIRELMRGRAIFMILHFVVSDYGQVCLAWARFLYGLMMIMASLPTLNLRISQEGKLICQKKSFHFHEYIRIISLLLWQENANFPYWEEETFCHHCWACNRSDLNVCGRDGFAQRDTSSFFVFLLAELWLCLWRPFTTHLICERVRRAQLKMTDVRQVWFKF